MTVMWENDAFNGMIGVLGAATIGLATAWLKMRADLRSERIKAESTFDAETTKRFDSIIAAYEKLITAATKDNAAREERENRLLSEIAALKIEVHELRAENREIYELLRAQGIELPAKKSRRAVVQGT